MTKKKYGDVIGDNYLDNIIKCDVMQGHLEMPVFHCKLLNS